GSTGLPLGAKLDAVKLTVSVIGTALAAEIGRPTAAISATAPQTPNRTPTFAAQSTSEGYTTFGRSGHRAWHWSLTLAARLRGQSAGASSLGLFGCSRDLDPWVGFMVEAHLVAPRRQPEISLLNRAHGGHTRACKNHCEKGEKKACGQCERNACSIGHGALLLFVSGQKPT